MYALLFSKSAYCFVFSIIFHKLFALVSDVRVINSFMLLVQLESNVAS